MSRFHLANGWQTSVTDRILLLEHWYCLDAAIHHESVDDVGIVQAVGEGSCAAVVVVEGAERLGALAGAAFAKSMQRKVVISAQPIQSQRCLDELNHME